MANMLMIFTLLSNIDVNYKDVERLYSDKHVGEVLLTMHESLLKKKGVNNSDAAGDGTGHSLTVSVHYTSEAQKLKDGLKSELAAKEKKFVHDFKFIDVRTQMYLAYGTSFKSETEAFHKARTFINEINVKMNSLRLDKFYSNGATVDLFPETQVYIIPKLNATINGSYKWKRAVSKFTHHTFDYLYEYYLRNHSEGGFSEDKREYGQTTRLHLEKRIDTQIFAQLIWHNLFKLA